MLKKLIITLTLSVLFLSTSVSISQAEFLNVHGEPTKNLDGIIQPGEYSGQVKTVFSTEGGLATIYTAEDGQNLWLAFDLPNTSSNPTAEVLLDINNDGGLSPQADDRKFLINKIDGSLNEYQGNGVSWNALATGGWSALRLSSAFGWQAEFKIPYSKIGLSAGNPKTIGMALINANTSSGSYGEPAGWNGSSPNSWGDVLSSPDNWTVVPITAILYPAPNATSVPVTASTRATFNKDMNPATINSATFTLRDLSNNYVPAAVSYNPATRSAILDPVNDLSYSTIYRASLNGVKDIYGNSYSTFESFNTLIDGAVAYWNMDEGSGNVAYDSTIYENHATLVNGPVWTNGKYSTGLNFDGINDYLNAGNPAVMDFTTTDQFSIETWVKFNDLSSIKMLVTKMAETSPYRGIQLFKQTDNKINFAIIDTFPNSFLRVMSSQTVTTGNWYHIVATYDGSNSLSGMKLYINGALDIGSADSPGAISTITTNEPWRVGIRGIGNYPHNGTIDETVIYNRTLAPDEIWQRSGGTVKLENAYAYDTSGGGPGIQNGDRVVLKFSGPTEGTPINSSNIDGVLALSNGHTWKDGVGLIGSAVWSSSVYANDTLTVNLSAAGSTPTVVPLDTVTINGINDYLQKPVIGSKLIFGSFGQNLPLGVSAYWAFNEGAGTIAYDSSGNNNHATLVNAPTWTASSKSGKALNFDGIDDFVDTPLDVQPSAMPYSTWEAWVYPTRVNYANMQLLFSNDDSGYDRSVAIQKNNSNWAISTGTSLWEPVTVDLNTWQHIAVVWTPSNIYFYKNGIKYAYGSAPANQSTTKKLNIGRNPANNNNFKGTIDEAYIFNRALSDSEIRERSGRDIRIISALASDSSGGGFGIQDGDKVVIKFDGPTNATPVSSLNINSALVLNNSHSWLDGNGNIISAAWSTSNYQNDTLTITLSGTGQPTVSLFDNISLFSGLIKDYKDQPVNGSTILFGTFGVDMPNGTVAYWPFDEGTGGVAYDYSGNENHGTLINGPTWTSLAKQGKAISFDGVNDYINAGSKASLKVQEHTLEAWVYLNSNVPSGSSQIIYSRANNILSAGYEWGIRGSNGNKLGFAFVDTNNALRGWYTDTNINIIPGTWTHVAGVWNKNAGTITFYVDGVLSSVVNNITGTIKHADGDNALLGYQSNNVYFNGKIDEASLYNRPLTPEEVFVRSGRQVKVKSAVASDSSGGGSGIQAGDSVTIKFDGPTQGTQVDASIINNALTLNNSHSWLDVSGFIGSAVWSSSTYNNDTLTISLSTIGSAPTINTGDIVSLIGILKDIKGDSIIDSVHLIGTFGFNMPQGLVGYWPLDEGFGTTAYDYSGNENHGTLINNPLWTPLSKKGNALSFDGLDDHVKIMDSSSLKPANMTVEAWINPTSLPTSGRRFMLAQYSSNRGWYIDIYPTGQMKVYMHNGSSSTSFPAGTISLGTWNHVAFTYNSVSDQLKTYLNGSLITSTNYANYASPNANLMFGKASHYDGEYFNGIIDEVAIYNRTLTSDEIWQNSGAAVKIKSARAYDSSGGGVGIQTGDKVKIKFDGPTQGTPIDASNINSALALSNGHSWLDGSGSIGNATWGSEIYSNDTLTITLNALGMSPTVSVGDITSSIGIIKDLKSNPLVDSETISGTFGLDMPLGLIGYWPLDEGSGNTAYDYSGNDNHGTLVNNPLWTSLSKKGNALSFDGTDDYVTMGDPLNETLDFGTDDFTWETWVNISKAAPLNNRWPILAKTGSAGSLEKGFEIEASTWGGNLSIGSYFTLGTSTYAWAGSLGSVTSNEWHHIVFTRQGNTVKGYLDGLLKSTNTTAEMGIDISNTRSFRIAENTWNYGLFGGKVDEVAVYNRALTSEEIRIRNGKEVKIKNARAYDSSGGGPGIQAGDSVTITFDGPTQGTFIDAFNINSAFTLSNGHSWLDGSGNIGNASWGSTTYTNDTLTISLSALGSVPTVNVGDLVNLDGTLKDYKGTSIIDSANIFGTFGFTLPSGLIGYWPLDEGSGATAYDYSGNDNHAGLVNNPLWTTMSKKGNALIFDGSDDYLTANNSNSLNPIFLTVEAWIKTNGTNNFSGIVDKFNGMGYQLNVDNNGHLKFDIGGFPYGTVTGTTNLETGNWNHVAATYDGFTMKVYVNGILEGSAVYAGGITSSGQSLLIGNDNEAGSRFFNGTIDEVILYNRALSVQEIRQRSGLPVKIISALASDSSGAGPGIQAGDKVTIKFDGPTQGNAIDVSNIDSALILSNGHSWKDGSNQIGDAVWNSNVYSNDTLTITLTNAINAPTVSVGDSISLNGIIKDWAGTSIVNSNIILGTFGVRVPLGAISYWQFNEAVGGIAYDSIGNNHGTISGASWITGKEGAALSFNGSNYVNIGTTDFSTGNSDRSIEAWVKTTATGVRQILSYGNSANGQAMTLGQDGGSVFVSSWSTPQYSTPNVSINDGNWHHVVFVLNSGTAKVYVDGLEIDSRTFNPNTVLSSGKIGSRLDAATEWWNGLLDEVIVYNRALTPEEVRTRSGKEVKIKSAVAYDSSGGGLGIQAGDKVVIKFDGPTQGSVIDNSNISNLLVLNNGHSWKDLSGNIGSAGWSSGTYTNDTLTITLSTGGGAPNVSVFDVFSLSGALKDYKDRSILGSEVILGTFGINNPLGAIAYWQLDEGMGKIAYDSSGNENHGTLANDPTWTSSGKINKALSFDGVNDYISTNLDVQPGALPFSTWETWVYPTRVNYGTRQQVLSDDDGGYDRSVSIEANTSNWGVFTGTGIWQPAQVDLNTWQHIVVVWTPTNIYFYKNGTQYVYGAPSGGGTGRKLEIGRNPAYGEYFQGILDEIKIYNKALTADEVWNNYGGNVEIKSAKAYDSSSGGVGIQAGDKVVIKFNGPTQGTAISASDIDSVLALNNGHSWKDGSGNIGSAVWSSSTYNNDTLTVTLTADNGSPSICAFDLILLNGSIKDYKGSSIIDSDYLFGTFGISIPSGATGYWPFDEGMGTIAYDYSGNDNHGTLMNGPLWTLGAKKGKALSFDGINDYVNIPSTATSGLTTFSVEMWIKTTESRSGDSWWNNPTLAGMESSGLASSDFGIFTKGGKVGIWGGLISGNDSYYYSNINVNDNNWHYIVAANNGSATKLYVDGNYTGSMQSSKPLNNLNFAIGGSNRSGYPNFYHSGTIDEVSIYNRALSAEEIRKRSGVGVIINSAFARDFSGGGSGVQTGDKVKIKFDGPTQGTPVNSSNINSALALNNGHTWMSGSGDIASAIWSSSTYTNDTLTVTLSSSGGSPNISSGDTISLNGVIKDYDGNNVTGIKVIDGNFGVDGVPVDAIAFWKLEEGTGSIAYDSTPNANDGTITAGTNNSNIVLGKPVTANYNPGFGTIGLVTNGVFAPEGTNWTNGNYAVRLDGTITIDLQQVYNGINQIKIQVDNNDTYRVDYSSDSNNWNTLYNVPTASGAGLRTRTASLSPVSARYLRIYPTGGDGLYSFSEIQVFGDTGSNWVAGKSGTAFNFDGNDYINVPNTSSLNPSTLTMEAWIKTNSNSTEQAIIEKQAADGYNGYMLRLSNNGKLLGRIGNSIARDSVAGSSVVSIGSWHHVALTYDGLNLKLYLDGILDGVISATTIPYTSTNLKIGVRSDNNSSFFNGIIDEAIIYKKALSAEEIRQRSGNPIKIKSVVASDSSGGGAGIQSGDKVTIKFDGPTQGNLINSSNVNDILALNYGHSWKDANNEIGSAIWTTNTYSNDTLTVTLSTGGGLPSVSVLDTLTLNGEIKDNLGNSIIDSEIIFGSFGSNLPAGVIAYWPFDEGTGNTAYDVIGNHNGTINGASWTLGKYSSGLSFNGVGNNVDVLPDISGNTAFTQEAWVWLDSTGSGDQTIVITKDGGFRYQASNNTFYVQTFVDRNGGANSGTASAYINQFPATGATLNAWNHLVYVNYPDNSAKFYINGLEANIGTRTLDNGVTHDYLTSIGGMKATDGWTRFLKGRMDEVVIYNRALTSDEIKIRYGGPVKLKSAIAYDSSGAGVGIQSGDKVVIKFEGSMEAKPIDASNINNILNLSNSHSWKDGSNNIGSAVWSSSTYLNDTLTVTLSDSSGAPTVQISDILTINGGLKDAAGNLLSDNRVIAGTFGSGSGWQWKTKDPPTQVYGEPTKNLDGIIQQGEYSGQGAVTFNTHNTVANVNLAEDGQNLWVSFNMPTDYDPSRINASRIVIDLNNDGGSNPATDDFQFIIRENGLQKEKLAYQGTINGTWAQIPLSGWEVQAQGGKTVGPTWQAEFKIPYSTLGITPGIDKIIGMSFSSYAGGFPNGFDVSIPDSWGSIASTIDLWKVNIPEVVSVTPQDGEQNVPLNSTVTATFSKAMNTSTINNSTFTLKDELNNPVLGTVSYNSPAKTATFIPSVGLNKQKIYTARVSSNVKDIYGFNLNADKVWSFMTLIMPDAPIMDQPSDIMTSSIKWNFTDTSSNEEGFKLFDQTDIQKGEAPANSSNVNEINLSPNTYYARKVYSWNSSGLSLPSSYASAYTLAVNPNVIANKNMSTWYNNPQVVFTNAASFGPGSVAKYKYVWNGSPSHTWTGSEVDEWSSGTLALNMSENNNYLHVRSYNAANVPSGSADYGPFKYDSQSPVIDSVQSVEGVQNGVWQNQVSNPNFIINAHDDTSGIGGYTYYWQPAGVFVPQIVNNSPVPNIGPFTALAGVNILYAGVYDNAGNNTYGIGFTFKYDNIAPENISLNSTTISSTSINSNPSAIDKHSGLASIPYLIERDDNSTVFVSADASSGWVNGQWNQNNLSPNTAYAYRLKAKDKVGNESAWIYPSQGYKYTLSENPTSISASDGTYNNKVALTWASVTSASNYKVYRDGPEGSGTLIYSGNSLSFEDTTAGSGVHTYYLYTLNAEGTLSAGYATDTGYWLPMPLGPIMQAPEVLSTSSIKWNFTDTSSNEDGFKLFDESGSQKGEALANANNIIESNLKANTTYTRRVDAYNSQGNSLPSDYAVATTFAVDPLISACKNIDTWYNNPKISFTNDAGFGEGGVAKYVYVWDKNPTYNWTGNETNEWKSCNLNLEMTEGVNYLHVRSFNSAGVSAGTIDMGPFKYDAGVPTAGILNYGSITSSSITVIASGANDSVSGIPSLGYKIERDDISTIFNSAEADSAWINGIWNQVSLQPNTPYAFRSKSRDEAGNESLWAYPSPAYKYTLAKDPASISASDGDYSNKIALTWPQEPSASGYKVYRDGEEGVGTLIYNGSATSFNDITSGQGVHTYYLYTKNVEGALSLGYASDAGYLSNGEDNENQVPKAPVAQTPTALSTTLIRWNFEDKSDNEQGFKLHDTTNFTKVFQAAPNLSYLDEDSLTANTQYTRHFHAYNSVGDSVGSLNVSRYTLAVSPNVSTDKAALNWYKANNINFSNNAGFGGGGVQYYRYVFDQNPTRNWTDQESKWDAGNLSLPVTQDGSWYLHVKSFNGDNVSGGVKDYGPFNFDNSAPAGSILINNDDLKTGSPTVRLDLFANDASGSGVSGMRFSINKQDLPSISYKPYNRIDTITLPNANGDKIVYAQFIDVAGNESEVVSDNIVLNINEEITVLSTKLSLSARPRKIVKGKTSILNVSLKAGRVSIASQKVTIKIRVLKRFKKKIRGKVKIIKKYVWKKVKTVRTNSKGIFKLRVKPKKNTIYRAFYDGITAYSKSTSKAVKIKVVKPKPKKKKYYDHSKHEGDNG